MCSTPKNSRAHCCFSFTSRCSEANNLALRGLFFRITATMYVKGFARLGTTLLTPPLMRRVSRARMNEIAIAIIAWISLNEGTLECAQKTS